MEVLGLAPIVITEDLGASRDFYSKSFGFTVVFEAEWYVHLRAAEGSRTEIAFMIPQRAEQHAHLHPAFEGKGMAFRFEVADADAECERLWSAGIQLLVPVRDEPWGERHFSVLDPNGVYIDVVQMIAPSADYAEGYVEST